MFRGVFVGVDHYSPPVTRLSCAGADARALAALFEDTLGGQVTLLLDGDASKAAIEGALESLGAADPGDFVVVSFSGHGTETHELVPVDVDAGDLSGTCLSLDRLAGWLDLIPARQLLVILDCCFSGGFGGARAFAPHTSRAPLEDRSSVAALARGAGRVVLTASGAAEPALETMTFGHGLLSHFLISGLQGVGTTTTGGRVELLDLFSYVMREVQEAAGRMNETQRPTAYGSIEGAPTLAVCTPGERYAAAFPERVRPLVTSRWESLNAYGLPATLIAAWAGEMAGLNPLQLEAINKHRVLDGRTLLVVAPTAAGKTMIGELAAVRALASGSRAVMLLPLKALVNDKYEYLARVYRDQFVVVRATGDDSDQVGAILSGHYDLALLTYEKFLNLVLGAPHVLRGVSAVVIDEVQTVSDRNRGAALEFLLTLLRVGHGRAGQPQIVALSAVIGDTNGFERWLGGELLRSLDRPVPLREGVVDAAGGVRRLEPDGTESYESGYATPVLASGSRSNKPWVIPLVKRLVDEGKKVIVFRSTRGDTVGTATYLADALALPASPELAALLPVDDRSVTSQELRRAVGQGVGFHNADLQRDERLVLEAAFRDAHSPLRVLVATTTLAMGVNTPAESVVVAGLTHPGADPYAVSEYKNMVGRAGRPGFSDAGESFIVATSEIDPAQAWHRYVMGAPEPVVSQFLSQATDPQTLILRALVALRASVREDDLTRLLESSFAVWRAKEQGAPGWNRAALDRDLSSLIEARLIDREPNGHLTLTQLGRFAGESGIEVRSVTNVASLLRFVQRPLREADLVLLAQVTTELDALHLRYHNRSHQERARWPAVLANFGASQSLLQGLHVGGGDPLRRAKRAASCLMFINDMPMAEIEGQLLQHVPDRSTAGPIRQIAARTRDVIETVQQIALFYGSEISDEALSADLTLRLEIGLPRELAVVAGQLGASLSRGEYLSLLRAGLTSWTAILAADPAEVATFLRADLVQNLRAVAQFNVQPPEDA